MNTTHRTPIRSALLGLALAAGVLAAPLTASADVPGQQQLQGRVTSFDGHYALRIQQPNGEVDAILLHQGTIINPTGLTLAPGMTVTIVGEPSGNVFAANEIDTPYQMTYAYGYPYDGPYALAGPASAPYFGPYWGPQLGYFPGYELGFGFGNRWR